ncbi:MAG TPA: transporter substrate-binding domain-containing protein [Candidatus Limnocylindria bacterium]|nr:transporter substrate-binding domain-containing protein [Candidatus Limnocylindria bacterium]
MTQYRKLALIPVAGLILAACQGGSGGSPSASADESQPASGSGSPAAATAVCDDYTGDDYLGRICEAGVIVVSTDPEYPPQSYAEGDSFAGFDIDVATEIADRLGVDIEWETPGWDAITAGNWSGRWDMSVGSMTITEDRQAIIDFTQPYYFTPAQMATYTGSGISSLDDLAGETVCVGSGTTYLQWLDGTLTLPEEAGEVADPPEGVQSTTFETDINCAEDWRAGRTTFAGWLSSSTTVAGAIASGFEIETVGDPVFYEPLAVAFDNTVEDNDSLVEAVDKIIGEMHDDGTLSDLSKHWYCADGSYPCEDESQALDLTVRE